MLQTVLSQLNPVNKKSKKKLKMLEKQNIIFFNVFGYEDKRLCRIYTSK